MLQNVLERPEYQCRIRLREESISDSLNTGLTGPFIFECPDSCSVYYPAVQSCADKTAPTHLSADLAIPETSAADPLSPARFAVCPSSDHCTLKSFLTTADWKHLTHSDALSQWSGQSDMVFQVVQVFTLPPHPAELRTDF